MGLDARFARVLCTRLCHDLGGMVGTLAGTLDFVQEGEEELLGLARETAGTLRQRLRLYAAAWGQAAEPLKAAGLGALLAAAPASPRVRFDLAELTGIVPVELVPLVLNTALLAAEALPRGGSAHLAGDAGQGFAAWPEGAEAAWPPVLPALLADGAAEVALDGGPRRAVAPLLAALAAELGWSCSLAQGAAAAPLLLLAPRR